MKNYRNGWKICCNKAYVNALGRKAQEDAWTRADILTSFWQWMKFILLFFLLLLLHANENNDDCKLSSSVFFLFGLVVALMNDKRIKATKCLNQMNIVLILIVSNKYLSFAISILFWHPLSFDLIFMLFISRFSIQQTWKQMSKYDLMKQSKNYVALNSFHLHL